MTGEDQKRVAREYIDLLCSHDLDAVVALYSEDAVLEDPVGSDPLSGAEAIRTFYANAFSMGVHAKGTGQPRCAGDSVAFPFQISVKMAGNEMTIDVIDVFEFNADGKICSMKAYWGPENTSTKTIDTSSSTLPN